MIERPWAELVFHVLAHVSPGAALAPSLHDPCYVEQVAALLGGPKLRPLGEDARVLEVLLGDVHDAWLRVQYLAWLFRSPEQALAVGARPLAALRPDEVDRPDLLPLLCHDAAELL
ncbi:MAG: hypothetical protein RMJ98_22695, partial [Myxococcales bacterium]|nr:hypothetical protein [Polyangiaceae bacterium]MDW8252114.1 hypothetical protein [Myxococcales bacterium]